MNIDERLDELQNDLSVLRTKRKRAERDAAEQQAHDEQSVHEARTWGEVQRALVHLIRRRREQGADEDRIRGEVEERFGRAANAHPTQHGWRPEFWKDRRRYDSGHIDKLFLEAKSQEQGK